MILLQLFVQTFWVIATIAVLLSAHQLEEIHPGCTAMLWAGIMILQMNSITALIGTVALLLKRRAGAELFLRTALLHQTLNAKLPVRFFTMDYLYTANMLVLALVEQQKFEEALQTSQEMLTISEDRFGRGSVESVEQLINLGSVYLCLNKHDQAEEATNRALAVVEAKGKNVSDREASAMAYALNNMGVAYADRRMPEKAQEMFKRALDINTNILHVNDNRLAVNFGNQGYALLKAGSYSASEEMLKRALNLTRVRTDENIVPVASYLNNLGEAKRRQGKIMEAQADLLESLALREKHLSAGHEHFGYSYQNLGLLYLDLDDLAQCDEYLNKALQIRQKYPGVKNNELKETTDALKSLADRKQNQGQLVTTSALATTNKSDPKDPALNKSKSSLPSEIYPLLVSFGMTAVPLILLATGVLDRMIRTLKWY